MKDKIFIFTVCAILLVFFIASPVIAALSLSGHLDALNTKNLFVTEKKYEEGTPAAGLLNAVEDGKTFLRNVYVNCIPFYGTIVSGVQSVEMSMLRLTDKFMQPALSTGIVQQSNTDETDETGDTDTTGDVYIPMGGNRVPVHRWIFNMLTVWFLTGLWHGASWNFILWGLYFGVILIAEKLLPRFRLQI